MPQITHAQTVIVGGGWAGLSAAAMLAGKQQPLLLFESAKQLGGRARRVLFNQLPVDNGQHMLLGAYKETLQLMDEMNLDEADYFVRRPLLLSYKGINGSKSFTLKAASFLPAPLHLAWGIMSAEGLSLQNRFRAILFTGRLYLNRFRIKKDISVARLLKKNLQSRRLIETLWEPLCVGALNTPIEEASAQVFLNVLKEAFASKRHHSDLLLTYKDLSATLPDPLMEYIESKQGQIKLARKVTAIDFEQGKVKGVTTIDGRITCDNLILATPSHITQQLLEPHGCCSALVEQLSRLSYQPICTVYLQYDATVKLDQENQGILGGTSQWLFDRSIYGQHGLMAVVISADGPHMAMSNDELIQHVKDEVATLYPSWPEPVESKVIREKRATFSCEVGCNQNRPHYNPDIEGLYLAGDYVNTGLPATLEGAVQSGLQCATYINNKDFIYGNK